MKLSILVAAGSILFGAMAARGQAPAPAPNMSPSTPGTVMPSLSPATPQAAAPLPAPASSLTLHDAEMLAIQNHPQIQAAQNLADAAKQQVREVRSIYYPQANASLTAADSLSNSRIEAGLLNNPSVYDRESNGVSATQLITDFGRTHQLSKSSQYHAQAQQENVVTSRADVLLGADQAYFQVLRSQAVLQVAQETVRARQLVSDQITTMARNELKSELDVSFANVNLSEAQLLLIQAQNDLQASFAQLSTALGYADTRTFTLAEEPLPPAPPADPQALIAQALQNRPELISLRLDVNSANSYATAERDLVLPTFSAIGVAGLTPVYEAPLSNRYAAAGGNINIPIFNGHLFGALYSEAKSRLLAQQQSLRDQTDRIARDVRVAWLSANSAYQRLAVTDRLLMEATQAMNLAQARYNLGLSSIVELTQAQLYLTQAEIDQASAKYDYQTQNSALNFALGLLR